MEHANRKNVENSLKTTSLLAAASSLLLVHRTNAQRRNGTRGNSGGAIPMDFGSHWFSDRIVLWMYQTMILARAAAMLIQAATSRSRFAAPATGMRIRGGVTNRIL